MGILFFYLFIFLYSRFLLVIHLIHISVYMSIPICMGILVSLWIHLQSMLTIAGILASLMGENAISMWF